MSKLRFGIHLMAAALSLSLLGCADESPWGSSSDEKGKISLKLTTDIDIKTSKPVFRSDDDNATRASGDLSSYTAVPSADDFSIRLEKNDGSYSETWTSLPNFSAAAAEKEFTTGSYTMTAYFGEKGKQDFGAPYFEGSAVFNILADQTSNVDIMAELKNSLVKINYGDGFKKYIFDYHASLRTEGRTDAIIFTSSEKRVAFIEPNNANLTVSLTPNGKSSSVDLDLGKFAPEAKTLHNINLDVNEDPNGYSTLEVTFDETLTEENIYINLTDELWTANPPAIECSGFENGATIDILEKTESSDKLQMVVNAEGKMQSAKLIIDGYTPAWGNEIDLCTASEEQKSALSNAGITAANFTKDSTVALFDFTEFGKSLKNGNYTIQLVVTDQNKKSESANVKITSHPVILNVIGASPVAYGDSETKLTVSFNGSNPELLTFQAIGASGDYESVTPSGWQEDTSTRAFDAKQYIFTLPLPSTKRSHAYINVGYNSIVRQYTIDVTLPVYNISKVDAYNRFAYLQVSTENPEKLALVTENIAFDNISIASRDLVNGIVAVSNLEPNKTYNLKSTITGDAWNKEPDIVTEAELTIPNGDFSLSGASLTSGTLNVGGKYNPTLIKSYQHTSSFSYTLPASWASINDLTAYSGSTNKNTWYVVPSSWLEASGQGKMRNVGYHHNGAALEATGGAANTTYYCTDHPEDSELNKAAGEFFLGSYSFNGSESRSEGISFSSRPASISFDYQYSTMGKSECAGDKGYVCMELLDASGNRLGFKELALEPKDAPTKITINIDYSKFGAKAATLKLKFKSSNQATPPIHIPTGSELDENQSMGNKTIAANQYHAVATGSELLIDNVTANYAPSPAAAPKFSSNPKRK